MQEDVYTRFLAGEMKVQVYRNRQALGKAAGMEVAAAMRRLLQELGQIRMVFAAAPSQLEFLATLSSEPNLDWGRVTAFHMDEYLGVSPEAPQRFGRFLKTHLFDRVQPGEVHFLDGANGIEEECKRYSGLIADAPIDIICLGIGENGHIAFNDPPVADFADPQIIKAVELDEACRAQQVHDGCFPELAAVPTHALTLTIPAMTSGKQLFCMVPGKTKREAVRSTLHGPISTSCPASILCTHLNCTLYIDRDSYGED